MPGLAILMLLLGMVSTVIIVVFALQNGRIVTVSFFDWSVEASLVLVIIVSAMMGFLAALFFELFVQIKLRYRLYKTGRQLKQLEEEIRILQGPKKETALKTAVLAKSAGEDTTRSDSGQSAGA